MMNRGLGSIMGYRGGGMPIARFQEGGVTDAQVRQYLDSRPGISESQIAEAMRITGASPEQVARVTGADPGYVSQRYNQYLDLVDKSTVRPFSGPPSPAVSPVVSNSISLTPAGIAALAPSANVSSPANVFSPADYGPPSPIFDPAAEIQRMQAQRVEAERLKQIELERPIVDPRLQPVVAAAPVDPNVEEFNRLIRTGDPANWQKAGELATSSGFTPEQVLTYLNDPNIFPEFGGGVTLDTVQSFVPEDKGIATVLPPPVDTGSGTGLGASEEFTNAVRGGYFVSAAQIAQNLGYNAQQAAEYINANAAALGLPENFAGVTGENLQPFFDDVNEKRINAGMDDFVRNTGPGNQAVVTDEAGNILSGPPDKVISSIPRFARQTQSNVPFAPLRRGIAQLRPAAFMPGLTSGQAPLGGSGFTPEALRTANQGLSPADRAYLMDVGGVSPAEASAAIGTPVGQLQAEYNQLRPGGLFSTGAPASRGLPEDFVLQTGAYGAPTPTFLALPEKKTATSAAETPLPSGSTQNTDTGSEYIATDREGGLIKMAEGGGPPKMAELSAKEAGSTFDISKYIDDQGRLVGGMSKPIRDAYGKIIGYESGDLPLPIQRDVVFNPILARREEEERERMRNMAEGGLANVAQNLADRGRKGDSMLVHMAPEEVAGLRALARAQGTDMTINPRTGLPEAFSLRKLFKAASFILPFIPIPGLFGMSSLLTKSILSGVAAGASAKGGFDFKQALGGGLRAYALGSLGEKMGGAPTPDGAPTTPPVNVDPAAGGVEVGVNMTGPDAGFALSQGGPEALNTGSAAPISRVDAGFANVSDPGTIIKPGMAPMTSSAPDIAGALPPGVDTVPGRMASVITPKGEGFGPAPLTKGTEIAMAGLGGFSLEKAAEEQRKYDMEATAIRQEDEERKRRFDELFARTLGSVRTAKAGGTINLAKGGMTYMEAGGTTGPTGEPRMVQGTGDGMSDSVPATIEGIQEARLANDEFVIPADVVADIGNGSSNAGAKKLYNAMDRIRKARHGTTKQPPEIRAERLMPA
jgi:hypothetical protein